MPLEIARDHRQQLRRVAVELLHFLIGDGHQLGRLEADALAQRDILLHKLADHALIIRIAGILIAAAHGIVRQTVHQLADLVAQPQIIQQLLRRLAELTGKGSQLFAALLHFFHIGLPELIIRVQIFQRPLAFNGQLASFGNFFRHINLHSCKLYSIDFIILTQIHRQHNTHCVRR